MRILIGTIAGYICAFLFLTLIVFLILEYFFKKKYSNKKIYSFASLISLIINILFINITIF